MPDFTKMIFWLHEYPGWLQSIMAVWLLLTALLVIFLIITPRKSTDTLSQPLPNVGASKNSSALANPKVITQETKGDNSPAVAGVEGDVNITVEQQKNAK